jgi:hypothetical protein
MEVDTMLMRTDPFRDLDRLTQQVFSRQLMLGHNLDTEHISASYDAGVLTPADSGRRAGQATQDLHHQQG